MIVVYSAAILNSEYWLTIVIFCSHFEQRLLIHKRDSIDISSWTASANSQAWFCSHFEPRLLIHKREFTAIFQQRLPIHKRDSIARSSWTAITDSLAWFYGHFKPRLLIHNHDSMAILNFTTLACHLIWRRFHTTKQLQRVLLEIALISFFLSATQNHGLSPTDRKSSDVLWR